MSNFDESQLKKENLFPDAKTDLPIRKRGLYKSTDKSTTKEDIETFRNYVLPFYNHGRYATNQYYNKDFINTFTAIDLVEKKGGRYKSLVDRKCKYAIKYIKEVTKSFYRHICK